MNRSLISVLVVLSLSLRGTAAYAQGDASCPAIVRTALDTAAEQCSSTARNQACYGNIMLEAESQPGFPDLNFTEPGDRVDVAGVQTLRLSAMDQGSDVWGVALLRVQANLPETLPGQSVTFVLFGDVEIQNAVQTNAEPPTVEVTATGGANVRAAPSTNAGVRASLKAGETTLADGRLEDSSWLHIRLPGADDATGWVFAELVNIDGDVNMLEVISPEGDRPPPLYGPMQAFYFSTGANDAPCEQAPDSGLLVQTPEGSRQITLQINQVEVRLSSTAYLQAQAGGELTVNLLEGQGRVTAGGVSQVIPAGTRVRVPLDANLAASGQPTPAEPYNAADFHALPIRLLERPITIAAALSADAIAEAAAPIASRLVPDFYVRYACVAFRSGDYTGCANLIARSHFEAYDPFSGDLSLLEVEADGSMLLSFTSSTYGSTNEIRVNPDEVHNFGFGNTDLFFIPLDNRIFMTHPQRHGSGFTGETAIRPPWEIATIGHAITTIAGQSIESIVYEGGWEGDFPWRRGRERVVTHYDVQSGLMLRTRIIYQDVECYIPGCTADYIYDVTWELVETNQPLAVVTEEGG